MQDAAPEVTEVVVEGMTAAPAARARCSCRSARGRTRWRWPTQARTRRAAAGSRCPSIGPPSCPARHRHRGRRLPIVRLLGPRHAVRLPGRLCRLRLVPGRRHARSRGADLPGLRRGFTTSAGPAAGSATTTLHLDPLPLLTDSQGVRVAVPAAVARAIVTGRVTGRVAASAASALRAGQRRPSPACAGGGAARPVPSPDPGAAACFRGGPGCRPTRSCPPPSPPAQVADEKCELCADGGPGRARLTSPTWRTPPCCAPAAPVTCCSLRPRPAGAATGRCRTGTWPIRTAADARSSGRSWRSRSGWPSSCAVHARARSAAFTRARRARPSAAWTWPRGPGWPAAIRCWRPWLTTWRRSLISQGRTPASSTSWCRSMPVMNWPDGCGCTWRGFDGGSEARASIEDFLGTVRHPGPAAGRGGLSSGRAGLRLHRGAGRAVRGHAHDDADAADQRDQRAADRRHRAALPDPHRAGPAALLPAEEARLKDLFGDTMRWADTLKPMQFTNVSTMISSFSGSTEVDLPVNFSYDLEIGSARYFASLEAGEIPLLLLFSGTSSRWRTARCRSSRCRGARRRRTGCRSASGGRRSTRTSPTWPGSR